MIKNNFEVSVIIPVYNGKKYINRCLDSLVNQTFKDFQTIIINDGSNDNSLELIKKYSDKLSDLIIVDKKNEGSWQARIDGIKKSESKYVTFIDIDDEVENNFIEVLFNSIKNNNSDISICGYYRIDSASNKVMAREMISFENKTIEINNNKSILALINTSNWNKMYKRELFDKAITYDVKSISFEDLTLNMLAYCNVKKISFNDSCLYKYYVNSNSLMNKINTEHLEKLKNTFINLRKKIELENPNMLTLIDFMAVMHLGFSITQRIYNTKDKNRRRIIKNLCKYIKIKFPLWKKYKAKGLKLIVIKIIFSLNLVYSFLSIYTFMINKLKVDVKW